jgi:hypothetical protein
MVPGAVVSRRHGARMRRVTLIGGWLLDAPRSQDTTNEPIGLPNWSRVAIAKARSMKQMSTTFSPD